jgi:hypothetical protein
MAYLPSDGVRESVRETLARMKEELGPPTAEEEAKARLVERIFALEEAKSGVFPPEPVEPPSSVRRWLDGREVAPDQPVASDGSAEVRAVGKA